MKTSHVRLPIVLVTALALSPAVWAQTATTLAVQRTATPVPPGEAFPPPPPKSLNERIDVNVDTAIRQQMDQVRQQVDDANTKLRRNVATITGILTPTQRTLSPLGQPLIVSTENLGQDRIEEIREDMQIMGKLVDDAVADAGEASREHRAMGIVVQTFSNGGSRDLFVSGHGAIFQNSVRFPLSAPENANQEPQATNKPLSAWETARREVRGEREPVDPTELRERGPEFSAERVESLKQAILKALANAHHFRHLSADDTVTAVVSSSPAGELGAMTVFGGGAQMAGGGAGLGGSSFQGQRSFSPNRSTLTLSVKKADAAALANGTITENEFRSRAKVAIY